MRSMSVAVDADRVDEAYDVLLPYLRGGLHARELQDGVELVALGEEGELPAIEDMQSLVAAFARGPVAERETGPDLAHALADLIPRHEIGGRIVLRDPLHEPAPAGWVDVVLARGAGFGTGAHPTTRHCLELLLDVEPAGAFADLGCGAGALTIAAAKLGFAPVVGIELLDRVSATAARNARANHVDVDFLTADLRALSRLDVETAVVNVSERDVHAHLAEVVPAHMRTVIVSGLDEPAALERALAGYATAGLREARRIDALRWPAVLLAR